MLALAAGAVCGPASARAAVLHDQADHAGSTATYSMGYAPPNDTQVADDFTVPAGQTWTISEIDVLGTGSGAQHINAYIYANASGLPGTQLFAEKNIVATGGPNYVTPLSGAPALPPGTYWVSIQVASAFWQWTDRSVQTGNPAAFMNPSGTFAQPGYTSGCGTTWTVRTTCYPASAGEPDQAFRLIGTVGAGAPSNQFTFGKLKLNKKKGTALLTINTPGPGIVRLFGKGIKSKNVATSGPQSYTLPVIPVGKTKKKLKKHHQLKVKISVTFTPTGGTANTQSETIRLKKKR
jgi:hypothetical protein